MATLAYEKHTKLTFNAIFPRLSNEQAIIDCNPISHQLTINTRHLIKYTLDVLWFIKLYFQT